MLAGDVVISEFLTSNQNGLRDAFGQASDWIELHNQGDAPVDLSGWYLTDRPDYLQQWQFPTQAIAPDEYLVVFASGAGGFVGDELHTNFRLGTSGEYLALVEPDGVTVASEFQPTYPPQVIDVSFGRDASGSLLYYTTPTPGAANAAGQPQIPQGIYISEFMAVNHATLADDDGDYADWIEIHNGGATAVNLANWSLTDNAYDLNRWTFPSVTVGPGEYLVVFASGNNRRDPDDELHANFKLGGSGEYLALADPSGAVVSDYEFYPPQSTDVSYGLSPDLREVRYFSEPTPGARNAEERLRITFDHARGFYDEPFQLAIASETAGATIRYTVDGSEPTATNGAVYVEPISIDGTTTLRAAAFLAGQRGDVFTQSYLFLGSVLGQTGDGLPNTWGFVTDYDVDSEVTTATEYDDVIPTALRAIPSVSLVLDPESLFGIFDGIYANPMMDGPHFEPAASFEWLDQASGAFGNSQQDAVLTIEHSTGSVMPPDTPKLSFRAAFDVGGYAAHSGVPVGGELRKLDALVLNAGYEDSWLHPDGFLRLGALYGRDEWLRRTQEAMGQPALAGSFVHVYVNGLYWGLYSAIEAPTAGAAARQLGGMAMDYDVIGPSGPVAGDAAAWNALVTLVGGDTSQQAAYDQIRALLDVENLADYAILHRFASHLTTDAQGWYAVRRRGANEQFQFWSWDSEEILGSACGVAPPLDPLAIGPEYLFSRLAANADFRQLVADRASYHVGQSGALSDEASVARLLDLELSPAIVGESARWGDYRRDAHPYSTTTSTGELTPPGELFTLAHWEAERDRIATSYLPSCGETLLATLGDAGLYPPIDAPMLSQNGGQIEPGFTLSIEAAGGTIYYTLDGSDPRLPGGALSPAAVRYTEPISLGRSVLLTARSLAGSVWSPVTEATFITNAPPPLVITEVMYHPGSPSAAEIAAGFDEDDAFEYIELTNTSNEVIVLDGIRFGDGVTFEFAEGSIHTLAPGDYVLVVSNADAFAARYGAGFAIAGEYRGRLANGGERIGLFGAFDEPLGSYRYTDNDFLTDGEGFSLVNASSSSRVVGDDWQRSAYANGSPGEGDPFLAPGSLVINEVYASGANDWIELFNATDENIEIGGWFLSDDPLDEARAVLADGLFVPAHGYLVLESGVHFGFGLSRNGEQLTLTSARDGQPAGYRESVVFDRAEVGVSFGRHVKSDGSVDFVRQAALTQGAANAGPLVSPVVINEVMYAPAEGGDEYVELFNASAEDVLLDGWSLSGVNYVFASGVTIPANGYVVVSPIDPVEFRTKYAVPASVPVVGPYASALDNAGEEVTLFQPQVGGEVRGDRVVYDDEVPWTMLADGGGASLVRIDATSYGNDAANWTAGIAGGTPGAANASIGQSPQSIPYVQGFENPVLAELAGWSFATTEGGRWDGDSDAVPPRAGLHHLRAMQTEPGDTIQEAMLVVDLNGFASAQNLALDFWIRLDRDAAATGDENYGVLEVRGAGGAWREIAVLRPGEGQYTHYAFDFDAELAAAGIVGESQAFVRLRHYGEEAGDTMWLDDFRVSQIDFFGPNVVGQSPAGSVNGPVTALTLTFDDPIDAASFSTDDIRIVGPDGAPIAVALLEQVTPMVWRATVAAQQLPGVYRVTVGPDITDTAGNPMNQGGATIDGQAVGSSPYRGSFTIATPVARAFPLSDGFEAGSLDALVGWSFDVSAGGRWDVTAQGEPHGGAFHLKSSQIGFGGTTKDAVLRMDLSALAADDPLVLDFWAKRVGRLSGNFGGVYVSGDGEAWSQVYALSPPIGETAYFAFDLRAALDAAGIAADENVYLRFSHTGRFESDVIYWDDVRVSDEDLFGPRVTALTPAGAVAGPVTEIAITFDEAIDGATLTAEDVRIVDPFGGVVSTTGPAVDAGDGRTFSLSFATAATIQGRYRVLVGPDVRDLAGNALNQDGDPISGETNGHDTFAGAFEVGPAVAAALPHSEDFEDVSPSELASWTFATSGSGRWALQAGAGHNGGVALVGSQADGVQATQDAAIVLDTASWPDDAPVYLDFFAKLVKTTNASEATVLISGDGFSWTWLATLRATYGSYGYYAYDVGQAMATAGISRDGPLYVRFSHVGGTSQDEIALDNVRLSDIDPFGPYIVSQTPLVEEGETSYFDVTFDEPVDAATFTPSDVSITLPGSIVTVTSVTTNDNRTFRVTLATPGLGGFYTLRIGPDIVGADGVPMNQDRDTINGETNGDDAYAGSLFVRVAPQTLPYAQSFESGSLRDFAGWFFKAQGEFDWGGGDWKIVSTGNPHDGEHHLQATQIADCWTKHDAVLALDMAGYVGSTDLQLEFFLQRSESDERNMAKLLVSGDGSTWTQVGTAATLLDTDGQTRFVDQDQDGTLDLVPTLGEYTRYRFDLDRLLAQAGLSNAETVYIDWHRLGFWKTSVTTIDAISVRSLSPPQLMGDVNGDGTVSVKDIVALQRNWGMATGASWLHGDMNGDGGVSAADLAAVVRNLGRTLPASAAAAAAIVASNRRVAARDRLLADWPAAEDARDDGETARALRVRGRSRPVDDGALFAEDTLDGTTTLRALRAGRTAARASRGIVRP